MPKSLLALMCVAAAVLARPAGAEPPMVPSPALLDYVAAPDDSFAWRVRRTGKLGSAEYAELIVTSQTWRNSPWKHQLFLLRPANLRQPVGDAMLFIAGGNWRAEYEQPAAEERLPREAQIFANVAEQIGAPVAILLQVPSQPLFGGKHEDEAIAYTFQQFMTTGDEQWPLLLPMVKSAVRGMDAAQQHFRQSWQLEIARFTVTGASKRGWTTWLTGAVDPRATAIAPMVIDMLNMSVQMQHQLATWGAYSEQIDDYTRLGLQERMKTPPGEALQAIVDPFSYRHRLAQPKLIILGTNDPYWPVDALNKYWDELEGTKYVLYVPNNGHGLSDIGRVAGSLAAFHDHSHNGHKLPELQWQYESDASPGHVRLRILADKPAQTVQAWVARAETRDFRQATWRAVTCQREGDGFVYDCPLPGTGYAAVFGEAVFAGKSMPYYLSTNVRILPPIEEEGR